jgi:hypothetical protein
VPVTATIDVTNTGNSSKDFFADARLRGKTLQALLGFGQITNVPLPLSLNAQPAFLVPTHSNLLVIAAQGNVPITMDISQGFGDPDRLAVLLPDNVAVATVTDPEIAPTFWFALPEPKGPFPPDGVHGAMANVAALANTNPFDSAVASDTGDIWAASVDPNAPYAPLTLDPGQRGRITLTITPSASSGTVVRGFVAIDTFNLFTDSGDEVVLLPYTYTVK